MKKHLSCAKLETALLDDINLTCRSASSRPRTFRSNRLPTANLVDPHHSSIGIKALFVNNLAERAPVPVSGTQKMIGTMNASKKGTTDKRVVFNQSLDRLTSWANRNNCKARHRCQSRGMVVSQNPYGITAAGPNRCQPNILASS